MLQQTSCVHLTTQSPIIKAILWRMAPAAVTRALRATARILMKMVGNFPLDVKLLAHCSSFKIRKWSCHRALLDLLFSQSFQLEHNRRYIARGRKVRRWCCHRGLFNMLFWWPFQLQNHRQHITRGRTVCNGFLQHSTEDRYRQSSGWLWSRICETANLCNRNTYYANPSLLSWHTQPDRVDVPRCFWTVKSWLRGYLQAESEGKGRSSSRLMDLLVAIG